MLSMQVDPVSRFDMRDLEQVLAKIHRRLAGVVIECLDWREFLARYDTYFGDFARAFRLRAPTRFGESAHPSRVFRAGGPPAFFLQLRRVGFAMASWMSPALASADCAWVWLR